MVNNEPFTVIIQLNTNKAITEFSFVYTHSCLK